MKRFVYLKKDLATIMADSLGRDSEHFYTYFLPVFDRCKILKALPGIEDIEDDEQIPEQEDILLKEPINTADALKIQRLINQCERMIKKLQFLVRVNKKVVIMLTEILTKLKGKEKV